MTILTNSLFENLFAVNGSKFSSTMHFFSPDSNTSVCTIAVRLRRHWCMEPKCMMHRLRNKQHVNTNSIAFSQPSITLTSNIKDDEK